MELATNKEDELEKAKETKKFKTQQTEVTLKTGIQNIRNLNMKEHELGKGSKRYRLDSLTITETKMKESGLEEI